MHLFATCGLNYNCKAIAYSLLWVGGAAVFLPDGEHAKHSGLGQEGARWPYPWPRACGNNPRLHGIFDGPSGLFGKDRSRHDGFSPP